MAGDEKSPTPPPATPATPLTLDTVFEKLNEKLDAWKASADEAQAKFVKKVNRELKDGRLATQAGAKPAENDGAAPTPTSASPQLDPEALVSAAVQVEAVKARMTPEQRTEFEQQTEGVSIIDLARLAPLFAAAGKAPEAGGAKPTLAPETPTPGRGQGPGSTRSVPYPRTQLEFAKLPKEAREALRADPAFSPDDLPQR